LEVASPHQEKRPVEEKKSKVSDRQEKYEKVVELYRKSFNQKRKQSEENIERYDRAAHLRDSLLQDSFADDSTFIDKYISQNKVYSSRDLNLFPSIEANKKHWDNYSPRLIDSKEILRKLKEGEDEKIIRKNKLGLEKLIADRKKNRLANQSPLKIFSEEMQSI